jgi:hypothetical protein
MTRLPTRHAAIVIALAFAGATARADEQRPFDWDRYHARQDACREANRIAAACAGADGIKYCDELSLREAKRAFSAFGPLGERSR